MKVDLVFQGGGAKGMAFVGAMSVIEANKFQMRRLVGTSAGAINAALLAAGYSQEDMAEALDEKDDQGNPIFESFMTPPVLSEFRDMSLDRTLFVSALRKLASWPLVPDFIPEDLDGKWEYLHSMIDAVDALPTGGLFDASSIFNLIPDWAVKGSGYIASIINLIELGGWFSARNFMDWMDKRLEQKGLDKEITLEELFKKNGYDLTVIGADITGQEMLVLNHITAPDLPVRWAVRMSMNIPFVWTPVTWERGFGRYRGKNIFGHRIVDGGALSNFAIRLTLSSSPEVQAVMDQQFQPEDATTIGFMLDGNMEVPDAPPVPTPEDEGDPGIIQQALKLMNYIRTDMTNSTNVLNTGGELAMTMMNATDNFTISVNRDKIVRLPVKDFGTLEFDMTEERRRALVDAAKVTTEEFVKNMLADQD